MLFATVLQCQYILNHTLLQALEYLNKIPRLFQNDVNLQNFKAVYT